MKNRSDSHFINPSHRFYIGKFIVEDRPTPSPNMIVINELYCGWQTNINEARDCVIDIIMNDPCNNQATLGGLKFFDATDRILTNLNTSL